MKTLKKSILKSGYYWELKPWYDSCPDELPVAEYKTEIFTDYLTHKEILKKYNITPYDSYAQAASVAVSLADTLKRGEYRIIYFKEDEVLYRFGAFYYDDSRLDFHVRKVGPSSGYDPGDGVCFGYPSDTQPLTLSDSDNLTLESAIKIVWENGFSIYKPVL